MKLRQFPCPRGPLLASLGTAVSLACLIFTSCKPAADASGNAQVSSNAPQNASSRPTGENALVQQAAGNYRQKIQQAATEHTANSRQLDLANVLDMKTITQREQLGTQREAVRKFLASNEALKGMLVNEEVLFREELAKLSISQARIESELQAFQTGIPDKARSIRLRELDQSIGASFLGALDFLDQTWGQWSYNQEYRQVQFSVPGALMKYTEFVDTIKSASDEQRQLQNPSQTGSSHGAN